MRVLYLLRWLCEPLAAELLNIFPSSSQLGFKFAQQVLRARTAAFAVTNGIQDAKGIGSAAFAVAIASRHLEKTQIAGCKALGDTAGPLAESAAGFGLAGADRLQDTGRVGAAAGAVRTFAAVNHAANFVQALVTGFTRALSDAAGSLAFAAAGGYGRIGNTMADRLQCAKRIRATAYAVAVAPQFFMCARIA